MHLGQSAWTVVGIFEDGGTGHEPELWADSAVVQSLFGLPNTFQTVRARLSPGTFLPAFKASVAADPRLQLAAESEADYYAMQAKQSNDPIHNLGWPLAIIMAFSALAGALNTMYSSVASRAGEIATLHSIGFGRFANFAGTCTQRALASTSLPHPAS